MPYALVRLEALKWSPEELRTYYYKLGGTGETPAVLAS